MTYTLTADAKVIARDADGAHIPQDPANSDWQAFQTWLAVAGNVPSPAAGPTRAALDAAILAACDATITAGFSVAGRNKRGSMDTWAASVALALAAGAILSADDKTCQTMAPVMNAWEGQVLAEKDRLIAGALTVADAHWPALPDGAAAFIASCDQG